jgi:hypothetical protein
MRQKKLANPANSLLPNNFGRHEIRRSHTAKLLFYGIICLFSLGAAIAISRAHRLFKP